MSLSPFVGLLCQDYKDLQKPSIVWSEVREIVSALKSYKLLSLKRLSDVALKSILRKPGPPPALIGLDNFVHFGNPLVQLKL